MSKIIFIGGIPGVGKTTLAYHLALKYRIDKVISLDVIKTVIKEYIQDGNPYLYTTTHEAWCLENMSVVDGFIKHSEVMNTYFESLIRKFTNEEVIIVEGATLTKEIIDKYRDNEIFYINMYLDNECVLKRRYESKMKMRKGKWLDNINNILKINDYLISQSEININASNKLKMFKEVEKLLDESIFL